jgi:hypothetical protein
MLHCISGRGRRVELPARQRFNKSLMLDYDPEAVIEITRWAVSPGLMFFALNVFQSFTMCTGMLVLAATACAPLIIDKVPPHLAPGVLLATSSQICAIQVQAHACPCGCPSHQRGTATVPIDSACPGLQRIVVTQRS